MISHRLQSIGNKPDGNLLMVTRGVQTQLNGEPGNLENWGKAIIPITYGYMDLPWDSKGAIWAAGCNSSPLVRQDDEESWQKDSVGNRHAANLPV